MLIPYCIAMVAANLMYKRSDFKSKYLLLCLLIVLYEGIYQVQVCVIPVIVVLITIRELARNNQKINKILLDIAKYAMVLLIATIIYSSIYKIVCKLVNVGQTANFFIHGYGHSKEEE